jgi:ABC-2 type transport system ATP-binding protein
MLALAVALMSACASSAQTVTSSPRTSVLAGHTMNGQPIACIAGPDGVRICHGEGVKDADFRLKSFDGVPLSLFVTLPPAPASGPDGNYPLVIQSHGWGDPAKGPDDGQYGGPTAREWAKEGYAVVQLVARGWGNSCGALESRFVSFPACMPAYVRRVDYRYEVRDAQNVAGLLVDEGIADPNRIGANGESYGGGTSLALATLNDRVMNPDGSIVPWTSPAGKSLRIAAAAPFAGWSDATFSMSPHGWTLDTQTTAPDVASIPVGVQKASIGRGLFMVGAGGAYLPLLGADYDFVMGFSVATAGEPYNPALTGPMLAEQAKFTSPLYLLAGSYGLPKRQPAPIFFGHGFTDDIFWADQVLLYSNVARALYPNTPIEVLFGDIGHQRAQSKSADLALMRSRIHAFFDHYVKGSGPPTPLGFTALTQTCPKDAPSGGPYAAPTWAKLHPGVVKFSSSSPQTIQSSGGNPAAAAAFDPVMGGLSCTPAPAADEGPGVATYRLPTPTGSGYTLLGSPTVTADLKVTGDYAYIAARLVDVDPATNTKTLVARGAYRIDPKSPDGRRTFQLSANGWRFAPGHIAQLELLGRDFPFLRASNGVFSIAVSNLELKLPVRETPGAPGSPAEVVRP